MSDWSSSQNDRGTPFVSGGAPLDDEAQRLLEQCIDRLNAGERIDRARILADHPRVGAEVLRLLRVFEGGEDAAETPISRTIGDYRLVRQIGRGGMGVVYEAWEASMERRVALKVLPAGIAADDKAFHRFLREAKTAGRIHHPNVVHVYGIGVREETPYYAMELIEGETLAQIVARLAAARDGSAAQRTQLLEAITGRFGTLASRTESRTDDANPDSCPTGVGRSERPP